MHSLWGAGELECGRSGHFLNDLYFEAADLVTAISPKFVVGSNPWEGAATTTRSSGTPTLASDPKPAVLTWHFTDYVYHTSMDTMDMVSARELRDVGLTTIEVGYLVATPASQAHRSCIVEDGRLALRLGAHELGGAPAWTYDQAGAAGGTPTIAAAVDAALELSWRSWTRLGHVVQGGRGQRERPSGPALTGIHQQAERRRARGAAHDGPGRSERDVDRRGPRRRALANGLRAARA